MSENSENSLISENDEVPELPSNSPTKPQKFVRQNTLTREFQSMVDFSQKTTCTPQELYSSLEQQLMCNPDIFIFEKDKLDPSNESPNQDPANSDQLAEINTTKVNFFKKSTEKLKTITSSKSDNKQDPEISPLQNYLQKRTKQSKTSSIEDLNTALNFLIATVKEDYFTEQWNDGINKYCQLITEYVRSDKNQEDYETIKLSAFLYRLMKFESNLVWEKINVLPNIKIKNFVVRSYEKTKQVFEKIGSVAESTAQTSTAEPISSKPKTREDLQHEITTARFIWENDWRQKVYRLQSPLIMASLMLRMLSDFEFFIDSKSLEEFSLYIDMAAEYLENSADKIDQLTTKTGLAKFGAGAAGFTAAGIGITGLILAPETGGLSLGLTIGAMSTGVIGGATSLTATIVKDKALHNYIQNTRIQTAKAIRYTVILKELVNDTAKSFEVVTSMLKDINAQELASNLAKIKNNKEMLNYIRDGSFIGLDLFQGIVDLAGLNVAVGLFKALNVGIFQPFAKIVGVLG